MVPFSHRTPRVVAVLFAGVAFASAAHAAPTWPDFGAPPAVTADGANDAAIIVAVEDYLFVPSVEGARRNAVDWYRYLTEARRVPVDRVHLVKDKEASREGILERVERATKAVGPGGTLWFVFVGHGAPAKDGNEGVLVGVDAQQNAVSLEARSVRQSELRKMFAIGKQANVVEVLDACFSGRAPTGNSLAPGLQPLVAVRTTAAANVTSLTAGTHEQFAGPLPNGKRPAFSYLVLGALRGWGDANKDGKVTAQEAVDYANRMLTVTLSGRAQTPQVTGSNANLVLSQSGRETGPDVAALLSVDGDGRVSTPTVDRDAAPSKPFFTQKTWGWTSVGAGALSLGAAAFFAARASTEGGDYKAEPLANAALYDEAKASTLNANVALYTGIGLAGLGTWLLVTAPAESTGRAHVVVGPGTLGVKGTF
jgi:hypothetical protein